jgi:small subunit ribosomal protein S2
LGIVTMKELLEAGVHFGHQTRRWDPHMKEYIFTDRNGIHIIDLQKTIAQLKIAHNAIKETAKQNGTVLFVGTKKQAQSAVIEEAGRCSMPYVANRWLGGMMTNFVTIKNSINRLKRIERMEVDGSFDFMTKKEVIKLKREKDKLQKNIGGVKDMDTLPDMIFIIDPKKEAIAVAEAMRVKVPIVAIIDTNCNPEGIDYPIPGNDDAIRAINLFASIVSSAVMEGQNEGGKFEITEETKIISLEEEESKEKEVSQEETAKPDTEGEEIEKAELEAEEIGDEGYLSDEAMDIEVSKTPEEVSKTAEEEEMAEAAEEAAEEKAEEAAEEAAEEKAEKAAEKAAEEAAEEKAEKAAEKAAGEAAEEKAAETEPSEGEEQEVAVAGEEESKDTQAE